jgi:dihydrofolate synthase / folylpolyglutamate synthase
MRDFATSEDPAVQRQLDRLGRLSLPQGRFGLETITALLERLGNPQLSIPPAFHVAGTNGKGSTCAFLRAGLEAAGYRVHVFTSPHLVRFNERIRVAGRLIDDPLLAALLGEVLDAADDLDPSFFEVTTTAAFLAFARNPADACVIEVGLGGRLDATNVIPRPLACGIASLGIDHELFLGDKLAGIAREKAGIARPDVPLVTLEYGEPEMKAVADVADKSGARLFPAMQRWSYGMANDRLEYRDAHGSIALPLPALHGAHQVANCALATAMLRHQDALAVPLAALEAMPLGARWPARLQRLGPGPLTALVPGRAVWLDGGHNRDAGEALAAHFAQTSALHLVIGMLTTKDPAAILAPLRRRIASVSAVPVPEHEWHAAAALAGHAPLPVASFADVASALQALPPGGDVLIAGSLYLAGEVLRLNEELPD